MSRWYETVANDDSPVISSQVRLSRNWCGYKFPHRLSDEESAVMVRRLKGELKELPETEKKDFEYLDFEHMEQLDRLSLREHFQVNRRVSEKTTPGGLILSEDETESVILNGEDHLRFQVIQPGLTLSECLSAADRMDDYVSERIPYAFSEKYGYLTTYPTTVGTGMKASVVLHLPAIAGAKQLTELAGGMGRFGVVIRGALLNNNENPGSLYSVGSTRTLGISEQETADLVDRAAKQLAAREKQIRAYQMEKKRLAVEDEIWKSYGILRYARKVTIKEAMMYLSQVRVGISEGILKPKSDTSIFGLMMEIQPASLQKNAGRPIAGEELDRARGDWIRRKLPEMEPAG